jgi:hypothetical protein
MSQKNVVSPRLANAPAEYDAGAFNQILNALRLYFNQLDNAGPIAGASQFNGAAVVSGLSFPPNAGATAPSLPTQANLSMLCVGDIYYDTSANNVLKVKV